MGEGVKTRGALEVGASEPGERRALLSGAPVADVEAVSGEIPLIITIDGPAGTGKSTVARLLAARLRLDFLDTGAMYRAATAIALDRGHAGSLDSGEIGAFLNEVVDADLHFDWSVDPPPVLAWGEPIGDRIREQDVSRLVSRVAALGTLRKHMVQKQRIIGHQHPRLVTEGRDQGSVVFPDAPVKFYLDALPEIRARRRAEQLRASGREADEGRLLVEIIDRDRLDSSRKDGPLTCAADAERLDTSTFGIDEVVNELEARAKKRLDDLDALYLI